MTDRIFVGGGGHDYSEPQELLLKLANRHGLIAGATGTGKTVTLQILAESFSDQGVPVFLADVKGDLSGLMKSGTHEHKLHDKFIERANKIKFEDYDYRAYPTVFWDLFGRQGHPVRTTISEMGPLLLSRLLELTEVQEGVLNIAFRIADEQSMLLLDLKDLRALLVWVGENSKSIELQYGGVSSASIGAIQRRLLVLENQGATDFFGEPALKLEDLMLTHGDRGQINVLAADELMESPRLYATFLLWLLSELFENLPEVGNPEKPKLVFFFDEAHLLFEDAPKVLVNKVEQVARLIRSKGVGVYFISQNPDDVPQDILGQLGNRVQHALRAFTPRDQRALKMASETFRANPDFDTEEAIKSVGVGEAIVSMLDAKGSPNIVQRTLIRPPSSQLGPITKEERKEAILKSPLYGIYDEAVDRESAFEKLNARAKEVEAEQVAAQANNADVDRLYNMAQKFDVGSPARTSPKKKTSSRRGDTATQAMMKSMMRSIGTKAGTAIVRGVMGGLFKGR